MFKGLPSTNHYKSLERINTFNKIQSENQTNQTVQHYNITNFPFEKELVRWAQHILRLCNSIVACTYLSYLGSNIPVTVWKQTSYSRYSLLIPAERLQVKQNIWKLERKIRDCVEPCLPNDSN